MSYVVRSVTGAEDVIDPRLLVVKGSGSTYVINSKIVNYWAELMCRLREVNMGEPVSDTVYDAFFAGLPRRKSTMKEFFLALIRLCKVANNFVPPVWKMDDAREMALLRWSLTKAEFDASVVRPSAELDGQQAIGLHTVGDYAGAIELCAAYAREYEPFMEKAYDIWRRGRAALVEARA